VVRLTKINRLDQQDRFIELRAKGVPYDQIVKDIGVSKPTLIKWGREMELEISNRKALELEVIQEKYYVSKVKRIELFGEELKRINEEITKREYSEMALKELLDMKVKIIASLKQEETEIYLSEQGTFEDSLEELMSYSLKKWKP
jgi:hypothetical protein